MSKKKTTKMLEEIEMAAGTSKEEARTQVEALVHDMGVMSSYPNPQNTLESEAGDIVDIIKEITDELDERRE